MSLSKIETIANVVHTKFIRQCSTGQRPCDWQCDILPNPSGACAIVSFELHEVLKRHDIDTDICINANHVFLKYGNLVVDATIGQFSDIYHRVEIGTAEDLMAKVDPRLRGSVNQWRVARRFNCISEAYNYIKDTWPREQLPPYPNPYLEETLIEVRQFLPC